METDHRADVLIVGAGPTGLFLAYALTRQGTRVRLIDRHTGPAEQSRAMGVQARTLEFYRQFGIADEAVALGIRAERAHVLVEGKEAASFSLADMGEGHSPFPFLLTLAQDVHERFLLEQLSRHGVSPEWRTELVALSNGAGAVQAVIRSPGGVLERTGFPFLAGCDGAGSITRTALGITFAGGASEGLFFVADVAVRAGSQDFMLGLGAESLAVMLPVRTSGTHRLIGIVPPDLRERESLAFDDVGAEAIHLLGIEVTGVNWFSTYRVQHRVAEQFRVGRCFLAGDAGHIHSPVGGQGMNTGLGDAMNLAWKLAAVIRGEAGEAILDTYDTERRAFAKTLVATTDAVFQRMVGQGWLARTVRLHIAPALIAAATRLTASRRALFATISQTRIAYRTSALSEGRAGSVRGGDRLPWLRSQDSHAGNADCRWAVHVFGPVDPAFREAVREAGFPLLAFAADAQAKAEGFAEGAACLVRPDGHVGLALAEQSAPALGVYLARHGLVGRR